MMRKEIILADSKIDSVNQQNKSGSLASILSEHSFSLILMQIVLFHTGKIYFAQRNGLNLKVKWAQPSIR